MLANFFNKYIFIIFTSAIVLSVLGLTTLYDFSIDNALFYKQLIIIALGIVACASVSFVDFRFLKQNNFLFYFYILTIVLLLALFIFGNITNSAQSWFRLGGFSLQPSEIAKLAIIGLMAKYFYKRHVDIAYFSHIVISFLYTFLIAFLVLKQPDLGSALVIFGIWGVVIFISGASKKHLGLLAVLAASIFTIAWQFIFLPYQKERILNFIDPLRDVRGSGYNVYQSIIAVGSGGIYGKGIGYGTQSTLSYLPENKTDFIFAAFAEEWGFVGSILCIVLFLLLCCSLLYLALSMQSNFDTLFMAGVASYFLIHFIVSVGMNLGVLPVTGIPLPFMSAGGSHIITEWLMLGIVFSLLRHGKSKYQNRPNSNEIFSF
jgi:rod shape determining protein RodA